MSEQNSSTEVDMVNVEQIVNEIDGDSLKWTRMSSYESEITSRLEDIAERDTQKYSVAEHDGIMCVVSNNTITLIKCETVCHYTTTIFGDYQDALSNGELETHAQVCIRLDNKNSLL